MFGAMTAASGNTLVVVAPFEPNDVTDVSKLHRAMDCTPNTADLAARGQGAAFVFESTTDGGSWTEGSRLPIPGIDLVEPLLPPDSLNSIASAGLFPTYSVAASAGLVVLGVGGDSASAAYAGSVRLYGKAADGWVQNDVLTSKVPAALFGMSVLIWKDVLFVGAPGEGLDTESYRQGAIYAYTRGTGSEPERLELDSPRRSTYLGFSLAADDDWLIAGAPGDKPENLVAIPLGGAAYAYRRRGRAIDSKPQQRLDFPKDPKSGGLGTSVALSGNTLAVGAPLSPGCEGDDISFFKGAVFLYELDALGAWHNLDCLDGPELPKSLFGWALAFRGDTLLVGAPWDTMPDGPTRSGVVYGYHRRKDGSFDHAPCQLPSPSEAGCTCFGTSLALGSDYTAIGSSYEGSDPTATSMPLDSGGVYAFKVPSPSGTR
jgi:hypothetical protein